eukprot:CAMPEP_0185901450 /NCGR_PEP_ID=MMETSP0196C-20130402/810_1 /TAXON_ID=2932 /ORGANISM="Alexandrium fundyense, Strain CCMP1719" /LENGTH=104 /DNA_ID=CAMNT_0028620105 /DNA_START=92 /DNA_END=403 /DNA_ORIENTATION=-
MSQRHAILRLISGVPKHDALVTSPNVKVLLAHMNAASDVRALLVDAHQHFACLVTEPFAVHAGQVIHVGVEPDLRDHPTDDLIIVDLGLRRDLARNHHHVVFCR